jgi:hypothetical protein
MRDLSKGLASVAAVLVAMSAPAQAANFLEDLFGVFERRSEAPGVVVPDRPQRARPRAKASNQGVRINNHIRVTISHDGDGASASMRDYLKSPDFTRRFAESDAGAAREAVAFLLKNDATLRAGDAVVTRAGVLVLDGDKRDFAPAAKVALDQNLRQRLMAFSPSRGTRLPAAVHGAPDDAQALPLAFSVRVSDGQPIRYVGGM